MIWILDTILKCQRSTFFLNYVQQNNDIHDPLFPLFGPQRIQKKNIVHHLHVQHSQNRRTKSKQL